MFPTGLVGVALLVLRVSIATSMLIHAADRWAQVTSCWMTIGFALTALPLCLGLFTPYVAVFAGVLQFLALMSDGGNRPQVITSMVDSGVLSVLGPGAYSIDSRLFGRRLLELPPKK